MESILDVSISPGDFIVLMYTPVYSGGQVKVQLTGKTIQNGKEEPEFLPRIGVVMKAAGSLQKTAWYGLGPQENYPDSKEAVFHGRL